METEYYTKNGLWLIIALEKALWHLPLVIGAWFLFGRTIKWGISKFLPSSYKVLSGITYLGAYTVIVALLPTLSSEAKIRFAADGYGFFLFFIIYLLVFTGKRRKKIPPQKGVSNEGITLRGRRWNLPISNPFKGINVVGGAGSGKSESVIKPILSEAIRKKFTGMVYDFKYPELGTLIRNKIEAIKAKETEETPEEKREKRKVFEINFTDATNSDLLNPLKYIEDIDQAREIAYIMIKNLIGGKDDFFSMQAKSILAATIWYFHRKEKEKCTIPHIICFLLRADKTDDKFNFIEILRRDTESEEMLGGFLAGEKSEKQIAGVLGTLLDALQKIHSPKNTWILSQDNGIDLNLNHPDNPSILILGTSMATQRTNTALISIIISTATRLMNTRGRLPSFLAFDEFPTLYIPDFSDIPSTGRSNRIATLVGIQDISQLKMKYKEEAESIMANLAYQLYGRTTNPETMKRMQDVAGKEIREETTITNSQFTSTSSSDTKGTSQSRSRRVRDRIMASDINELKPGEFLVFTPDMCQIRCLLPHKTHEIKNRRKTVSKEEIQERYELVRSEARTIQ